MVDSVNVFTIVFSSIMSSQLLAKDAHHPAFSLPLLLVEIGQTALYHAAAPKDGNRQANMASGDGAADNEKICSAPPNIDDATISTTDVDPEFVAGAPARIAERVAAARSRPDISEPATLDNPPTLSAGYTPATGIDIDVDTDARLAG
jgi:hypothetical protein